MVTVLEKLSQPQLPSAPQSPPPMRWELVQSVRRRLRLGIYDSPHQLEAATERLLAALSVK